MFFAAIAFGLVIIASGAVFAFRVTKALRDARVRGWRKQAGVWAFGLTFPIWAPFAGYLMSLAIIDPSLPSSHPEYGTLITFFITSGTVASLLAMFVIRGVTGSWLAAQGCLVAGAGWLLLSIILALPAVRWNLYFFASVYMICAVIVWHFVVYRWLSRWVRHTRIHKRHLCHTCDYNLAGLPRSSPCPECGVQRSKNRISGFLERQASSSSTSSAPDSFSPSSGAAIP